jgi:hypothetical protein
MKAVSFFTDDIKIIAHTATHADDIGKPISVREFAQGQPVSLYTMHNGDLMLIRNDAHRTFIEGPEMV